MNRFTCPVACIFILAFGATANAEHFSIKCEQTGWHFMTFDTQEGKVVYETASGRALKGHIAATTEGEIRFDLLQMGSPKFDLIWKRAEGVLTWIGLPNDATRPTVTLNCIRTELRPILSMYDNIAPTK
jgi:hypothetical protein